MAGVVKRFDMKEGALPGGRYWIKIFDRLTHREVETFEADTFRKARRMLWDAGYVIE